MKDTDPDANGNDMINKDRHIRPTRSSARSMGMMLLCGLILIVSRPAAGIEGFPGSTWGNITHSVNGLTGSGAMGWINQGIDWTSLPGGVTLNTYAEYRYRSRTKENVYYNAEGPAVGLELRKSFYRLGVDYYWEKFPKLGERSNNREAYLNGYVNWDFNSASRPMPLGIIGFPGAFWADLTYDIDGLTGSGAMGWINQGIDWVSLPGGILFNTYAEYRYRSRTKQNDYYNAEGPAVGLEFKKASFRLGADYYWEQFPKLGEHSSSLEVYLIWYLNWNLNALIRK